MFDLLSEIRQTLSCNKLRTGLTGFAVAWGIMMMIALLGMSNGLKNNMESEFSRSNSSQVTVWRGHTSVPYNGYNRGRAIELRASNVDVISDSHSKYIGQASSVMTIDSAKVIGPADYVANGINGVWPEEVIDAHIDIVSGRFINKADIEGKRKTMVVSKKTALTLFGTDEPEKVVGQRVKSLGLSWLIVGLYAREWNEDDVYVPFSTAVSLSGGDAKVWTIRVNTENVTDEATAELAETDIRHELARIHNFDPEDRSAAPMWNSYTMFLQAQNGIGILNYTMWIIGLFTILSGIVGVSNIMFVSVRERTHEIGIRRAIGAKRRNILTQVMLEGVVITTAFGYLGIVLGVVATRALASVMAGMGPQNPLSNPVIDLRIAFQVTALLIVAGAIAGLFPALKATKVKPVEALRDE